MYRHRIDLLDSFRSLAVFSVLFYHFTYRWRLLIPIRGYDDLFAGGFLGVQLFFVISGFVIGYTLENTASAATFFKNRFIRLFPPLLLCSLITYTAAVFFDTHHILPFAHRPANLLPSLTLITPAIWNLLTHREFAWINGSYWSLWVEIQFYALAAALYYSSKKNFLRNALLLTILLSCIKYIPGLLIRARVFASFASAWKLTDEIFNIVFYIPWFSLGLIFHHLYKGASLRKFSIGLPALLVLLFLYSDRFVYDGWVLHVCVALLFGLLIWKKQYLRFLDIAPLRRIGRISYSIYLIHEVVGVLLLLWWGPMFSWSPLLPLLLIVLCILFAELSWRFYEKPLSVWFKRKISF